MKRRVLSLILSTVLLVTSVSVPAWAEPADDSVDPVAAEENVIVETEDDIEEEGIAEEEPEYTQPEELFYETYEAPGEADLQDLTGEDTVSALDGLPLMTGDIPEDDIPPSVHNEYESGIFEESDLPSSYIDKDILSLRNQNPFGTCWAFSATGIAEANLKKKYGESKELSVMQTIYFATHPSMYDEFNHFAKDTSSSRASGYLDTGYSRYNAVCSWETWDGLGLETTNKSDPLYYFNYNDYTQSEFYYERSRIDSELKQKANNLYTNGIDKSNARRNYVRLLNSYRINMNDRDVVKRKILENGAVGMSYHAWGEDDKKVYPNQPDPLASDNLSYYLPISMSSNHAVTIVGWDDNYSASKFSTRPAGNGAWLIRNSWNYKSLNYKKDSYNNYFWMSYYDKGIAPSADAVEVTKTTDFDHNYQYSSGMAATGIFRNVRKSANVFTAKGNSSGETLKAVSARFEDANVHYTVNIYKNLTSSANPESGTLVSTTSGDTYTAGYYTIPLSKAVSLPYGTTFSVVLSQSLGSTNNSGSVVIENPTPNSVCSYTPSIEKGQSFIKSDNSSWIDIAQQYSSAGNVYIRAFTCNGMDPNDAPGSFEINTPTSGGDIILGVNNSCTIAATVTPASKSLTYTSSNPDVATVSSSGVIVAKKVGSATITVKISGESFSRSFRVDVKAAKAPTAVADGDRLIHFSYTRVPEGTKGYTVFRKTGDMGGLYAPIKEFPASFDPSTASIIDNEFKDGTEELQVCYLMHVNGSKNGVDYSLQSDPIAVILGKRITNIFYANDGTSASESVVSSRGCTVNWPADPVRTGYQFKGWATTSSGKTAVSKSLVQDTSSHNYYAIWSPLAYSNLFYLNDGTQNYVTATSYYDQVITLPAAPTRKGYDFVGWTAVKGGSTAISSSLKQDNNVHTYYAMWAVATYKVRFDPNGGYGIVMPDISVVYGSSFTAPVCTYTRDNYTFTGWNTQADGRGMQIAANQSAAFLQASNNEIITLYAQWEKDKLKNRFYRNDGTAYYTEVETAEGEYVSRPENPERTGYIFGGWTSAPGGTTAISDRLKQDGQAHNYYALWRPISYKIKFLSTSTSDFMSDITVMYDENVTIPECTFVRTGYTFDSWNTKEDGSGTKYTAGQTVRNLTDVQNSYIILYAQWEKDEEPDDPFAGTVEPVVDLGGDRYDVTLVKGSKVTIPELKKLKTDGKAYKAYSTNSKVASISSSGKITAKGKGECEIFVNRPGAEYHCTVKVTAPVFAKKSYAMNLRNNQQEAVPLPLDFSGTDLDVVYSIPLKSQAVATVDENGVVTAYKTGKVKVTATVLGVKYSCSVSVYDPHLQPVRSNTIRVNKNVTLKVANGVKTTSWWSEDPSVATVTSKGKVVGRSTGETTIYALNNGIMMQQKIYVTP